MPVIIDLFAKDETLQWLRTKAENWMFNEQESTVGLVENHYFPNMKYEGRIIGYAKVGRGKVYVQDYHKVIEFPGNVAFIYDTYIAPDFRGLSLAPFFITEIMKLVKQDGMHALRCHIPPWNKASMHAYTKVGFKNKKFVRSFKIFGFRFLTSDPLLLDVNHGNNK